MAARRADRFLLARALPDRLQYWRWRKRFMSALAPSSRPTRPLRVMADKSALPERESAISSVGPKRRVRVRRAFRARSPFWGRPLPIHPNRVVVTGQVLVDPIQVPGM